MKISSTALLAAALLCTAGASSFAQAPDAERSGSESSVGGWAGLARHAPGGPFGRSVGNNLAMVAVRRTRTFHRSAGWSLAYSADLVPVALVSMPARFDTVPVGPCSLKQTSCVYRELPIGEQTVYGLGGAPFGLQLNLAPGSRVQPFFTTDAGGLWFRAPVPHPLAGRFNFTAEVGGGLLYRVTHSLGVTAGYRLQHISNGGTRPYNPGIDNNLFYLGLVHLAHESSSGDVRP